MSRYVGNDPKKIRIQNESDNMREKLAAQREAPQTRSIPPIIKERPPNYEAILKVFPGASKNTVMFAYDGAIYNPSGQSISDALIVHESVHLERQRTHKGGTEGWWKDYLANGDFRYHEELIAHRAEYLWQSRNGSRPQRRAALKEISKKLAASLYGRMVTKHQAAADILEKPR